MTNKYQISEHFYAQEFVCKCGQCEYSNPDIIEKIISPLLILKLEQSRARLNVPIIVTNGVRCENHHINIYKGRYGNLWEHFIVWDSFHLVDEQNGKFYACDTIPKGLDLFYCYGIYCHAGFNCVGLYKYEISPSIYQYLFLHSDVGHIEKLTFYEKVYKK